MLRLSLSLVLLACVGFQTANGQCETDRYTNAVYSAQRTISNQEYATDPALAGFCNLEFWTFNDKLELDVYEPVGDTTSNRPVIVFAHGGAFVIGNKRFIPVEDYCFEMAKHGYVVVSIDYRKCFNALSSSSSVRAVYRAVQDMNAAIRWVKGNAALLNIDTNYVFAGGNSSGSFMAMHAAYADESERIADLPETLNFPNLGCLDCSGSYFEHSSKPAGVVNLWGAVFDTTWIEPNDPPLISFHGGLDLIVYPTYWAPFSWIFFPPTYGSLPITSRVSNLNINHELHYFPLQGHEPWLLSGLTAPYYFNYVVDNSSRFLFEQFLKPETGNIEGPTPGCTATNQTYTTAGANPSSTYCWNISGGTIISSSSNSSEITVMWTAPGSATLTVTETNSIEATGDPVSLTITVSNSCCPTPYNLAEIISGPTSATVSWDAIPEALSYELEGGKTGGGTRTLAVTTTSRTIDILKPSTNYTWRVRSLCASDLSEYSASRNFTTPSTKLQFNNTTNTTLSHNSIFISPNPNKGQFSINLDLPTWTKPGLLYILDATGREVYSAPVNSEKTNYEINLNYSATQFELPSGIYHVVFVNDETKLTKRFAIQ